MVSDDVKKFSETEVLTWLNAMFNCDQPRRTILFMNLWHEITEGKYPFELRVDLADKYNSAIDKAWSALCKIEVSEKSPHVKAQVLCLREALMIIAPNLL